MRCGLLWDAHTAESVSEADALEGPLDDKDDEDEDDEEEEKKKKKKKNCVRTFTGEELQAG